MPSEKITTKAWKDMEFVPTAISGYWTVAISASNSSNRRSQRMNCAKHASSHFRRSPTSHHQKKSMNCKRTIRAGRCVAPVNASCKRARSVSKIMTLSKMCQVARKLTRKTNPKMVIQENVLIKEQESSPTPVTPKVTQTANPTSNLCTNTDASVCKVVKKSKRVTRKPRAPRGIRAVTKRGRKQMKTKKMTPTMIDETVTEKKLTPTECARIAWLFEQKEEAL